jgi:hypothetical protein
LKYLIVVCVALGIPNGIYLIDRGGGCSFKSPRFQTNPKKKSREWDKAFFTLLQQPFSYLRQLHISYRQLFQKYKNRVRPTRGGLLEELGYTQVGVQELDSTSRAFSRDELPLSTLRIIQQLNSARTRLFHHDWSTTWARQLW